MKVCLDYTLNYTFNSNPNQRHLHPLHNTEVGDLER